MDNPKQAQAEAAARPRFGRGRRLLTPPRFPLTAGVRLKAGVVGGVSGEWVEPTGAASLTLIYLHGGGYYSCSPETHRPVTAGLATRGFRVLHLPTARRPNIRFLRHWRTRWGCITACSLTRQYEPS